MLFPSMNSGEAKKRQNRKQMNSEPRLAYKILEGKVFILKTVIIRTKKLHVTKLLVIFVLFSVFRWTQNLFPERTGETKFIEVI